MTIVLPLSDGLQLQSRSTDLLLRAQPGGAGRAARAAAAGRYDARTWTRASRPANLAVSGLAAQFTYFARPRRTTTWSGVTRMAQRRRGYLIARVLVVEDNAALRETLVELLEHEGHTVTAAAQGVQALSRLRRDAPDVMVLDLVMPVLDGWAVLQAQRVDPGLCVIPVIVTSGGQDLGLDGADGQGLGHLALPKPYALEQLLHAVDDLAPRRSR